jgi:hypothetical protein
MNRFHWYEGDGLVQLAILVILLFLWFMLWPQPQQIPSLSI